MKKFEFQGIKQKNYFEGWYFRFTSEINYAIIFAITNNEDDPHAFIQVFNENMEQCIYQKYELSLFKFENDTVHIGNNILSLEKAYINVGDFIIDLDITQKNPMTKSAMGYLSKAPLDCFQEVILMSGYAKGTINKTKTKGKIYIEKTYGNKFPKRWIWLQSNHSQKNSEISFSVGYIPFLNLTVKGWLLVLDTPYGRLSFHSLDGSSLKIKDNTLTIKSLHHKVVITHKQATTIKLVGPTLKAKMDLDVFESLTSTASITVYKDKNFLYEDHFYNVGLEHMNMK